MRGGQDVEISNQQKNLGIPNMSTSKVLIFFFFRFQTGTPEIQHEIFFTLKYNFWYETVIFVLPGFNVSKTTIRTQLEYL